MSRKQQAWPKTFTDTGFIVKAKTLNALFAAAGRKLTQVQVKKVIPETEKIINLSAPTPTDLLYRFLSELIYLKDVEQFLGSKFEVKIIRNKINYQLKGKVIGDRLPENPNLIIVDAKAVTYHQLYVKKTSSGWQAKVVVDI